MKRSSVVIFPWENTMTSRHALAGFLASFMVVTIMPSTATEPNSLRTAYTCETDMLKISCKEYRGIISIHDVNFPKDNAYYCDNGKADPCVASQEEENYLKCALRKWCDGKPSCRIPMLHGIYNYIQLPCRNLGIKIRITSFYDCIKYGNGPTPTVPDIKCSTFSAKPSNDTIPTKTSTEATTASKVTSATTTGKPSPKWIRKRPSSCNISKEHHLVLESNAPSCCSSVTMTVFIFILHWFLRMQ